MARDEDLPSGAHPQRGPRVVGAVSGGHPPLLKGVVGSLGVPPGVAHGVTGRAVDFDVDDTPARRAKAAEALYDRLDEERQSPTASH